METPNELTCKQYWQLVFIAKETQPVLPFNEVAILEIMKIVLRYSNVTYANAEELKKDLTKFKCKYYCHGFKANKGTITEEQYQKIGLCIKPRFVVGFDAYKPVRPIELVAFIKALRACRDYIRGNFSDDAFSVFLEKVDHIKLIVN